MRKDRSKVKSCVPKYGKTDTAMWKERTHKSLTDAEKRIRILVEAYLAGEITSSEFKHGLPPILSARDRETHQSN
jgi:hypothetical protein